MFYTYAVNFAPGFEGLVGHILKRDGIKAVFLEEGFALVESKKRLKAIDLKFASSFVEVFDHGINLKDINFAIPKHFVFSAGRTFNIRNFNAGRPARMDEIVRVSLIKAIISTTGLKYSAFEPDIDFVISKRNNGFCFFGIKLRSERLKYEKGELHSDVVNLLCELGGLRAEVRVLDAFGGHGGISGEVVRSFEPSKVVVCEKESRLINILKSRFVSNENVSVVAVDVVRYLKNSGETFDLILADPPWGEFEERGDLSKLYFDFLQAAKLRLAKEGSLVFISSAKEELETAVSDTGVKVEDRLDVLISGKKVLVLKLG